MLYIGTIFTMKQGMILVTAEFVTFCKNVFVLMNHMHEERTR